MLVQLAEALPANVKVLIVADRGFGDQKLYQVLTEELKFDYVIRKRFDDPLKDLGLTSFGIARA